jgi:hypothetical protein
MSSSEMRRRLNLAAGNGQYGIRNESIADVGGQS